MSNDLNMKIYLTNLGAYNSGKLLGKWVDLPSYDIQAEIDEVVAMGDPEYDGDEWFITDYDAPFDIDEYADVYKLNELAEEFENLEDYDISKVLFLKDTLGYALEYALENFEDVIFYPDMSMKEVAEDEVENGLFGDVPEKLEPYIDYEAIAYSLESEGYYSTKEGVFYSR